MGPDVFILHLGCSNEPVPSEMDLVEDQSDDGLR